MPWNSCNPFQTFLRLLTPLGGSVSSVLLTGCEIPAFLSLSLPLQLPAFLPTLSSSPTFLSPLSPLPCPLPSFSSESGSHCLPLSGLKVIMKICRPARPLTHRNPPLCLQDLGLKASSTRSSFLYSRQIPHSFSTFSFFLFLPRKF